MTERIVVIGADAAGMSAASQAKRIAGDAIEIVAFERGTHSSYAACGIPYWLAGDVDDPERLIARSPDAHRRNGIDLRMRTEVKEIDLAAGRVTGVPWSLITRPFSAIPPRRRLAPGRHQGACP